MRSLLLGFKLMLFLTFAILLNLVGLVVLFVGLGIGGVGVILSNLAEYLFVYVKKYDSWSKLLLIITLPLNLVGLVVLLALPSDWVGKKLHDYYTKIYAYISIH